jgi:hypothetical protein
MEKRNFVVAGIGVTGIENFIIERYNEETQTGLRLVIVIVDGKAYVLDSTNNTAHYTPQFARGIVAYHAAELAGVDEDVIQNILTLQGDYEAD